MMQCAGVGRSSSSPVPDDTDVPTASDSMSRGQSAGPDAHPVSVTSAETHTPSISPSGTPGPDAMLSPCIARANEQNQCGCSHVRAGSLTSTICSNCADGYQSHDRHHGSFAAKDVSAS